MKRKNMNRKSISTQWSKQTIATGLLELVYNRYDSAEQQFSNVVNELTDRSEQYKPFRPYLWTAAFGQGLSQGLKEQEISREPKPILETVKEARKLCQIFISFAETPANPTKRPFGESPATLAKYKALGKSYAALGLGDEAKKILDYSRNDDSINSILGPANTCIDAHMFS